MKILGLRNCGYISGVVCMAINELAMGDKRGQDGLRTQDSGSLDKIINKDKINM